jgi:hypothetical protein
LHYRQNARLLLLLDQRHQAETRAITDKSEVARNLTEAKKRLENGNRRIAQLERWLDEIYNDKDFEVIPKRGAYSNGHICRGAYPLPKMQVPLALTERRRAQILSDVNKDFNAKAKAWTLKAKAKA